MKWLPIVMLAWGVIFSDSLALGQTPKAAVKPAGARLDPASSTDASRTSTETTPATQPYFHRLSRDEKVKQLLDYLEKDYAKKAVAPYWITRAMGVISLARSPRPTATTRLLEILEKDKSDVVRLLAWEAVLGRANELDAKTFTRYSNGTLAMANKDIFHGDMRAALLRVMAAAPPTAHAKRIWQQLFTDCNAWEPQDTPVLDALGDCVKAWHSGSLVEELIGLVSEQNIGPRAEYVLQRAGCTAPSARDVLGPEAMNPQSPKRSHPNSKDFWLKVRGGIESWFAKDHANWKESSRTAGEPWKSLKPHYVGAPYALASIDPDDKLWYADLELGRADLSQFEAVFVVDATGSMGDVLDWLRRDVARMATVFQLICKEPVSIGITFYRDFDCPWVVKHVPLTTKLKDLEPDLEKITADGGGDIPEAVREGMTDAIQNNKWSKRTKASSKVMILIGDAPPHPETINDCVELAKKAAAAGMTIHAAKVTTEEGKNDLSSFDEIAKAGGGSTVAVEFKRVLPFRFLDNTGKERPFKPLPRPEVQITVAPEPPEQMPGEAILTHVLADTISKEYRDRVEPLARTLLAYSQVKSEPEKRVAFPANTPSLSPATYKPQK